MKLAVILSSPGKDSATREYVNFLKLRFPEHEFELHDVGRGIRRVEKDRSVYDAIVSSMKAADVVLWTFPVYTMLVPSALVRFVELLYEREGEGAFKGQRATALSTSEHFYDHTAHRYCEEVSEDLGMGVLRGFSAQMEDILTEDGPHNVMAFFRQLVRCVQDDIPTEIHHRPVRWTPPAFEPPAREKTKTTGRRRIVVITDHQDGDHNLGHMIEYFNQCSRHTVDVFKLHEIGMKGSCLGCLQCIYDGSCVYKDDFAKEFDNRVRTADVLVFASTLRARYFSATFKAYFDRNFRNGHRPILHGKPIGFLISGPLRQLATLRDIVEAIPDVQRNPRLGVVTDEYEDQDTICTHIDALAQAVDCWEKESWIRPPTFMGVGGRKIFRDLMYSMRGIVRADHAYYRQEGLYDFPQRDHRRTAFNVFMTTMMEVPWTRRWTLKKIGELKVLALRKVAQSVDNR